MHTIKKYKNRKLYDTTDHKYIKLTDIANFIRSGVQFKVLDVDGKDITVATIGLTFDLFSDKISSGDLCFFLECNIKGA